MKTMYDRVSNQPAAQKMDKKTRILLVICGLVIAAIILSIVRFATIYPVWFNYVEHLSDSTSYAYSNGGMRAELDGKILQVKGENTYNIYTYLTTNGVSAAKSKRPERDWDLRLDYRNESYLMLWDMEAENEKDKLFVCYENADGYQYAYISRNKDLDTIIRYLTNNK